MLIALIAALTVLAVIFVRVVAREYRSYRCRRRTRHNWEAAIVNAFGQEYLDLPQGKHRIERNPAAHRLCNEEQPCAHKHEEYRRVRATYYIDRARAFAEYLLGVTAGLHCDYSTTNLPGLSTPAGSSTPLTAASTSTPRPPISADR